MKILLSVMLVLALVGFSSVRGAEENSRPEPASENSFETEQIRFVIPAEELGVTQEFVFRSAPALRGRLELSSTSGTDVEVIYRKVLYAQSQAQADSFARLITLTHEVSGNSLILSAEAPRNAPWRMKANLSGQIECEVYLPARYSLVTDIEGYFIGIKGPFPEADLRARYCEEVRVSRIELGLKIDAANTAVVIREVKGPTVVTTADGSVKARNIDSGLGAAVFENTRGSLSIVGFTGEELRCVNSEGKIELEKLLLLDGARGFVSNSGINSDIVIDVENISASTLTVENQSADVRLLLPKSAGSEFRISADSERGEISVEGIPLITELVEWGRLRAHTPQFTSTIAVDTRGSGKVAIRGKEFSF